MRAQQCYAFYHFEWEGWRNAIPWMMTWLTWPSALHDAGASGYHTPEANNGLYLFKQANLHRNAILTNSERWKDIRMKKLQLVLLPASWGFDALNAPSVLTPATRRWAEAHGKPWAVKPWPESWKPKSRDFRSTVPSWVPWLSGVCRGANMVNQQSDYHTMSWGEWNWLVAVWWKYWKQR